MTKQQEEQLQDGEFVEIPEIPDTPVIPEFMKEPEPTPEPEFVPLKVRVILVSGSNLEFTVGDLENTPASFSTWVDIAMKDAKSTGFIIGNYFIQDTKIQFFEHII